MSRTLRLEIPRVFAPLLKPARYKGAYGGRGSGKSHFFGEALIKRCLERPTRAICVREVQHSLEQSVKRLLSDKIHQYELHDQFKVTHTNINTPNGGVITFIGMQNHTAESVKSLEGFDVAWVEEAQSLSQRSLDLLRPTIREPNSELWFSWNPRSPKDPIDKLLRSDTLPSNALVVGSTYRNNPKFPEVLKAEMEWDQRRDPDKYAHIWLGEYERNSEARVFKNWRIEEFETPEDTIFYLGGDWGFSVDPTVLVRMWLRRREGSRPELMIDWEVYKIGVEIDALPMFFDSLDNGMARRWPIVADSARPETISYLQRHGYPLLEPAMKGANSVKEGVIFLQGYDIVVHPRAIHVIDELTMYSFKKDKLTNMVTPILEDRKNHTIDSIRYGLEKLQAITVEEWVTF